MISNENKSRVHTCLKTGVNTKKDNDIVEMNSFLFLNSAHAVPIIVMQISCFPLRNHLVHTQMGHEYKASK